MSETTPPRRGRPAATVELPSRMPEAWLEQVVTETVRQAEARVARPSPFDLHTFAEIDAFCERVTRSNLCPKDFKGKPDDALVAVLKGKELGLPAMASLESIAVVNGRPSLWGEVVPGLCMSKGLVEDVAERFEGDPLSDDYTAICIVKRKGRPTPMEGRFSAADVRRAGLKNVHLLYPRDMMMWRARHRAWRGAFPDILKGIPTAELEQEEANRPDWEMPQPQPSWWSATASDEKWDNTWFRGLIQTLVDEQNAWKWLRLLLPGLEAAPSLRDVEEIEAHPNVRDAVAKAPPAAKEQIEQAMAAARARFSGAAPARQDAPTPAKPPEPPQPDSTPAAASDFPGDAILAEQRAAKARQTPPEPPPASEYPETPSPDPDAYQFEYFVMSAQGEPAGDTLHTDAALWADFFIMDWERSTNREALEAHNADAIADAIATSEAAAATLARLKQPDEPEPPAPTIEQIKLPVTRGKPDWEAYIGLLRSALPTLTQGNFLDWCAMQTLRLTTAPASARLAAVKLVAGRANEIGLQAPAFAAAAQPQPSPGNGAADKDAERCQAFINEIRSMNDLAMAIRYTNAPHVSTLKKRWEQERPELAQRLTNAFDDKQAELRAGA